MKTRKTCFVLLMLVVACVARSTPDTRVNPVVPLSVQERAWLATLPTLRVGVDPTAAPLSMIDPDGDAHGLAMDYLHDAMQALGVSFIVVHEDTWARTVGSASSGDIDVLAAASPDNADLAGRFEFTTPYAEFPVMIVTRNDFVTVSGPADLGGRSIAANLAQGSVAAAIAALPQTHVLVVATAEEGLADVAAGRVDAYVGDIATAEFVIRRDFPAQLKLAAATGQRFTLAMAVSRRYAPLRPLLDRALASVPHRRAQGIRNTWLRSQYTWGGSWKEITRKAGPAGLVVLLLFAGLANAYFRLRRETSRRQRSEEQLADVTRHIPAVVFRFLYHDDHRIQFRYVGGNPEPIFNVSAETFIDEEQRAFATIDERDQVTLLEAVAHAASTLTPMHAELRIQDAVPERWVISHAVPRRVDAAVEFTGYWIDVSEQHKQSAQLAEAKHVAESATKAKSQFVATISHEIRTPMHGVIGMLEMLRLTPLDASQKKLLSTAETSAEALLQILDDVLDFSRIEAGRLTLEDAPVDCRKLAVDVAGLYAWQVGQKALDVTVRVDPAVAPLVLTDGGRLRQVLLNIFSNAVKFTTVGGIDLHIGVLRDEPRGQRLRFTATDTGIGIAQSDLEAVLAPFTQAEASTTRRFGGSGLGLAISRRLVDLLGGTLTLSSCPGEGTRVVVELDVTLPGMPATPSGSIVPIHDAASATAPLDVLVAEDHAINRELVAAQLSRLGHRFRMAHDGEEALAMALSGPVDVVLTDLHMPVMDGVSLTQALRMHGQSVRIVAMTANASEGERDRCVAAGMDDFLTKPVRLDALARSLALPTRRRVLAPSDLDSLRESFGTLALLPELVERFETATLSDLAKRPALGSPIEAAEWVHRIAGGMRVFGPSLEAGCAELLERDLRGEYGELAMGRLVMFVNAANQYLAALREAVDRLPPE